MKINCFLLLIIMFWAGCNESEPNNSRVESLPFYSEATFTPHWISPDDAALERFHRISPFKLVNQEGETVTEKDFEGKIYVADFFFTSCPGLCPRMASNMMLLQDAFVADDEILLLSHSVTPEKDSVPVLKEYAENKGVLSHKWHLVTGAKKDIYKLGRQDYFVEEDLGENKSEDDFLHTENFVLVDKNRHIRGVYNGLNKTAINQLISDIETLKKEG
ncbi:MAG: SCO family protein [Bacteroidota bacterium]